LLGVPAGPTASCLGINTLQRNAAPLVLRHHPPTASRAMDKREPSLRAAARARYRQAAEDCPSPGEPERARCPLPDPPPQAGEGTERTRSEGSEPSVTPTRTASPSDLPLAGGGVARAVDTPLTEQVRALYEETVVPVREIARLAGVTERTIYKYARK